jgi:hypothetical protein
MTKGEFLLFEKLCKKMWSQLAETGDMHKPYCMDIFKNCCPACSVANIDCCKCPVDVWRNKNIEDLPNDHWDVNCELKGEPWVNWLQATTKTEKKKYAAKIAALNWTYDKNLYPQKITKKEMTTIKKLLKEKILK